MVEEMKLYLKNLGPINESNLEISKVTVVAGHNATGKSTLSKLLYSFLRSNSFSREELAINKINNLIQENLRYISRYAEFVNMPSFNLFPFIKLDNLESFDEYKKQKDSFINSKDFDKIPDNQKDKIINKFCEIDKLIGIVIENKSLLYIDTLRSLLSSEFSSNNLKFFINVTDMSGENSFEYIINCQDFDYNIDDDAFKSRGTIILNDVFYIDSVSILDLFENNSSHLFNHNVEHNNFLKKSIYETHKNSEIFDNKLNKNIYSIENEINDIIGGKFDFIDGKLNYISNEGIYCPMQNTASGIKQIGVIQILLENRKLKDDCVLIIDEPEVNLHPEWQFKLANILILISKKLDVSIYINTHSPLFIESLNAFSKYYELENNTNYHLAEESEVAGKYNIYKVDSTNLFKIYDNLGKPYLKIDDVRISSK